ncbi:MAG: hypothetical protein AABZ44_01610, partial [Elusimicrobiota bacterium]
STSTPMASGDTIFNLFKLAVYGALSIASNVIEGLIDGYKDTPNHGITHLFAVPIKTALNAVWNTFNLGVQAINIASDGVIWQWAKPSSPAAQVHLIGSGPRLRTAVLGGFMTSLRSPAPAPKDDTNKDDTKEMGHTYGAYAISSAFINVRKHTSSDKKLLAHEISHTRQTQNSYLIDLFVQRMNKKTATGVELQADELGTKIEDSVWLVD